MFNLYELEYGMKQQKEKLNRVDRVAWKRSKVKEKKANRRTMKRLGPCIECIN